MGVNNQGDALRRAIVDDLVLGGIVHPKARTWLKRQDLVFHTEQAFGRRTQRHMMALVIRTVRGTIHVRRNAATGPQFGYQHAP